MPLLTGIRDAVCAHLKAALPDALRVEAFAGVLDFERVAPRNVQFTEQASIFVAAGQCENAGAGLELDCEASFWIFSVGRHASRPTIASNAALELAQKAVLAVHGQTFGVAGIAPAYVRFIEPVSDESLEKAGFWVWQICFTTRAVFTEDA